MPKAPLAMTLRVAVPMAKVPVVVISLTKVTAKAHMVTVLITATAPTAPSTATASIVTAL